jgi:hypothetical protein
VRRPITTALGLIATVALAAGCGATPPQAPLRAAMKLDSALSGIAHACGLSYQTTALARKPVSPPGVLEAVATRHSDKLASVYAQNPDWIYQGETVRTIVQDSISALDGCGLEQAKAELVRRTGGL